MSELQCGFFRFDAYATPINAAAGCPPPYTIHTVGGPRTLAQVHAEREACRKKLAELEHELLCLYVQAGDP